ncbi:MAG: formylglycine-generating enzyme family protein [Cyanothece sp. SIO1E1]|nr:formylglycine-generating enzyme family protein [Cyanothece sp. SIO1E1]
MEKLRERRQQGQAQYFTEDLGNGVGLDMVLIPGGSFEMGSPEDEEGRHKSESPQHSVTVPTFFMGRYPVTQEQWEIGVGLPKVKRELKSKPSRFEGDRLPVERVSWYEAVEFCDRLSRKTGRDYRLPSEAEWEYACRAGTKTPFHFGETITSEVANYRGTTSYGRGPKGEYRNKTTPVDHFGVANGFGLCDMHGNVWEWCLDHWHETYGGAPTDGSVWLSSGESKNRIIRGGSWLNDPRYCRSAFRDCVTPGYSGGSIGFRVVCAVRGTP